MKVKIIKCSGDDYWYKDLVGVEFEVIDKITSQDYILKEDYDLGHKACWRHIYIKDAEVINEE